MWRRKGRAEGGPWGRGARDHNLRITVDGRVVGIIVIDASV